jgi:DNA-binding winged helix-turn-helix (wHTH) protein/tetratricopeptide (TPR) repeat protein
MKSFAPFRLDTTNQCLWRADARVPLTPKAFDVLRYLVERAGRLVTQDEILEDLWPETFVNREGVRKYILEIRKVLEDRPGKPTFIETFPKRGYQFIARVIEDQSVPQSGAAVECAETLVGRDAALGRLQRLFARALDGHRQVIFITGEPGIGKTTLVDAFRTLAAGEPNLRIATGQCIDGFGTEAYYPMLEAIGSLLSRGDDLSFTETVAKLAPTWLAQFPSVLNAEQRDSLRRDILGSTRGRVVREICEALEELSSKHPLIVVLEDLHWSDAATLDVISAVARRRERAKLVFIGTYRPVDAILSRNPLKGLKEDLLLHHLCEEVALERLEDVDVAEYLAREFALNDFPPDLANLIHANSGGNALFMAAIVRDIVKRGLIVQDRGTWTLSAPTQDAYPGIPETLQEVLETQFEQLSPDEQRVLETCSVAGERFSVWAATVMLESSPAWIEETCDGLAHRQQFLRSVGIHPTANGTASAHYEFRHSLYRQALYRRLSTANKSNLHRRLGEGLMGACDGGKPEYASELALHFKGARDYERATRSLLLAAENDSRRFAHGDSIHVLQHALELSRLLDEHKRTQLEIEILQRIGDAHYALGAMSDSASAYESAAVRAAEAGLVQQQIHALSRLAVPAWYLDSARGNQICERAVEVSRQYADPLLVARTQLAAACFRLMYDDWREQDVQLCLSARQSIRQLSTASIPEDMLYAYVQTIQGEYKEALQQAETGISSMSDPAMYLLALGAKSLILIGSGRFGELLRMIRTGRELAEKNGEDPWVFIFREAWLRALCFDFEGVRRLSEIVMRSDAEQHAAEPRMMAMVGSGYAELYRGRCDKALQYFAEVRDPRNTSKFLFHWRWRLRAQLGCVDARLQAGDVQNARTEVDSFLESALATEEPNLHAFAWEASARVAIAEDDRARAAACIDNALTILEKFDLPVVAWRVHATAWDFCSEIGESNKAEEHRVRAKQVILRLRDTFEPGEPLRESLVNAAPVRRILGRAVSV